MILSVTDAIRVNINTALTSLGSSKAFNSICHATSTTKVKHRFNFPNSASGLIFSYLDGRSQFVILKEVKFTACSTHLPLLRPLFFITYVNDLCLQANSGRYSKVLFFADNVSPLFNCDRISWVGVAQYMNDSLDGVFLSFLCYFDMITVWIYE